MNLEGVVYVGERDSVAKEYERRRWNFFHGKSVRVPTSLANILLATQQFILEKDWGQTVTKRFPHGGRLLFRRWGALGDLIMFRAACACFLRHHPEYELILRCQDRFADIFQADTLWIGHQPMSGRPTGAGDHLGIVSFDQVAEADHRGDEQHRVQLFLKAMTNEKLTVTREDWVLPIPDAVRTWVHERFKAQGILREQRDRPLVAVQLRGSSAVKTLPEPQMADLIRRLSGSGYNVLLVEPERARCIPFMFDDRIYDLSDRDAMHTMAALAECDLAITMDSGALWMAHAALCPVLAILGPTRPAQRINMHPDFAAGGARSVCLNVLINCPACFESAKACGGKYTCMRNQPDWRAAIGLVHAEAVAMLSAKVPASV